VWQPDVVATALRLDAAAGCHGALLGDSFFLFLLYRSALPNDQIKKKCATRFTVFRHARHTSMAL
jgi:hypothetical protein